MKRVVIGAALAAFLPVAAMAADANLPAVTKPATTESTAALQAQIAQLRQQVATLQRQLNQLQAQKSPSVCISVWCA